MFVCISAGNSDSPVTRYLRYTVANPVKQLPYSSPTLVEILEARAILLGPGSPLCSIEVSYSVLSGALLSRALLSRALLSRALL